MQDPIAATSQTLGRSMLGWLEMCQASAAVGLDYWRNAATRGATVFDVALDGLRWSQLVAGRRKPTWSTPNRIVETSPITLLRDFSIGDPAGVVPSLILPPQAGHHSCIVDYSRSQSQVLTAQAAGLTQLFVLEWLEATQETKDSSIGDYLATIKSSIEKIGGPVNLIGDCQGGWLATIYTALHPEDVATLTIAGAPIDFHAGDAAIAQFVKRVGSMDPYRLAVALAGGVWKGESMLGGFIALQPETELQKHLDLLLNLHDESYVQRYSEFQDWYVYTQDIAGALYLWIVEHLFLNNELIDGTLEIDGRPVRLGDITCPVNLLAGAADHITPPAQVFVLADHVGTPADQITQRLTSGGHLGLFMGHAALTGEWLPLLQRVAARHQHAPQTVTATANGPAKAKTKPQPKQSSARRPATA